MQVYRLEGEWTWQYATAWYACGLVTRDAPSQHPATNIPPVVACCLVLYVKTWMLMRASEPRHVCTPSGVREFVVAGFSICRLWLSAACSTCWTSRIELHQGSVFPPERTRLKGNRNQAPNALSDPCLLTDTASPTTLPPCRHKHLQLPCLPHQHLGLLTAELQQPHLLPWQPEPATLRLHQQQTQVRLPCRRLTTLRHPHMQCRSEGLVQ